MEHLIVLIVLIVLCGGMGFIEYKPIKKGLVNRMIDHDSLKQYDIDMECSVH
jgi:hypothetical protein